MIFKQYRADSFSKAKIGISFLFLLTVLVFFSTSLKPGNNFSFLISANIFAVVLLPELIKPFINMLVKLIFPIHQKDGALYPYFSIYFEKFDLLAKDNSSSSISDNSTHLTHSHFSGSIIFGSLEICLAIYEGATQC